MAAILFLSAAPILADTVILKNGVILEGVVYDQNPHILRVQKEGGAALTIRKSQVIRVIYGDRVEEYEPEKKPETRRPAERKPEQKKPVAPREKKDPIVIEKEKDLFWVLMLHRYLMCPDFLFIMNWMICWTWGLPHLRPFRPAPSMRPNILIWKVNLERSLKMPVPT